MLNEFDGNARELYVYINNDAKLWGMVESHYRIAEAAKMRGEYVSQYLEADLRTIVLIGANKYVRDYMPTDKVSEHFPFECRREAARLIVKNFETEINCGNSWL